jgi:hypothetical protein
MTSNVSLRDVTEVDLPIFFEQQLDPDAIVMAAFPSRDRDAFMSHWAKILMDDSVTLQTILFDGQVAGKLATGLEKNIGAKASPRKPSRHFWSTSRRDPYMPMWRNTISAPAGSWRNVGSRY